MTNIYVETKNKFTPEYVFLSTLITRIGIAPESYEIVPLGGKDNLRNAGNSFKQNTILGGKNIIIFDADTPATHGGYTKSLQNIKTTITEMNICVEDIFLYPNNQDDGIFENILENIMRKDLHKRWLDCYTDYEKCLGNEYQSPNLKGKLHTYLTSQKDISKTKKNKIGQGQWLFDNPSYWDLENQYLTPIKDFLKQHLQ